MFHRNIGSEGAVRNFCSSRSKPPGAAPPLKKLLSEPSSTKPQVETARRRAAIEKVVERAFQHQATGVLAVVEVGHVVLAPVDAGLEGMAAASHRDVVHNLPLSDIAPLGPIIINATQEVQRSVEEVDRSEEHTSELQSLRHLVCR